MHNMWLAGEGAGTKTEDWLLQHVTCSEGGRQCGLQAEGHCVCVGSGQDFCLLPNPTTEVPGLCTSTLPIISQPFPVVGTIAPLLKS